VVSQSARWLEHTLRRFASAEIPGPSNIYQSVFQARAWRISPHEAVTYALPIFCGRTEEYRQATLVFEHESR
jgi:hypothetical protein